VARLATDWFVAHLKKLPVKGSSLDR